MKKKKILKRIEELERLIKKQIDSTMEYSNILNPITHPIYLPDPILFNKYCKWCKYPILRLDKLATVLKNGQRIFRYEK